MDIDAITQSQDKILEDLGLVKKGDLLSLRAFCQRKVREKSQQETKRQLVMQLVNQKKKKTKKPLPNLFDEAKKPQEKVKTRKIQIGWIHFNEKQERCISVRLQKGGGTREVHVPLNANVQKIVDIASEIFFQNRMSTFGPLEDMEVGLANFRSETLPLHTLEGNEFTLQYYITSNKATRVRMYLKTQIKSTVAADTSDMENCDTDEPSKAKEEFLIERERETDLFSDSEQEITNAQAPTTEKTTKTMPQKGREGNSHKPNHIQARGTKRPQDDKRERQGNTDPKKACQNAEHASIMEKIDKSKNSIGLLQAHLEKGTCPKSLRYNVRANIMPDEDFKSDISLIKKRAEHDFVGALVKFHHRRVEKLTIKLRKLEQAKKHKRNNMDFTKNVKTSDYSFK
ncbi:hypothetical protein P5673_014209 [Acropora cervicornis]|uniref:Uncharacterized protein n=1 Tax=Acropora cervicornis TaxID=6130 RepID=A0AAD9V5Z8_ACRCE|nr:hypothetical protein P5673_014209 [Acropora cervicornis]